MIFRKECRRNKGNKNLSKADAPGRSKTVESSIETGVIQRSQLVDRHAHGGFTAHQESNSQSRGNHEFLEKGGKETGGGDQGGKGG